MYEPTFDSTRYVHPPLVVIVLYFSIIMILSMMIVTRAHAAGNVSPVFVSCSNYLFQNAYTGYERGGYTTPAAACGTAGVGAYAGNGNYYCVGSNYFRALCMAPVYSCPDNSTGMPATNPASCTCDDPYVPDSSGTSCVPAATCPVDQLTPLDPAMQPYEDGLIDMANETQATRDGAACIVREANARHLSPQIVSGYRPAAYQTHIREVYDKWQLLQNNNDAACADTKSQVETEFDYHGAFAHQPGNTSRHSSGLAVDISLTNYTDADTIAAKCNMSRPVPNDGSHFESPR